MEGIRKEREKELEEGGSIGFGCYLEVDSSAYWSVVVFLVSFVLSFFFSAFIVVCSFVTRSVVYSVVSLFR